MVRGTEIRERLVIRHARAIIGIVVTLLLLALIPCAADAHLVVLKTVTG